MHTARNTLSKNVRALSVELFNKSFSASIDLEAQVKQAHWNVRGANVIALHELLDTVAAAVGTYSDQIAERTGGLGGTADLFTNVARGIARQLWLVESHAELKASARLDSRGERLVGRRTASREGHSS